MKLSNRKYLNQLLSHFALTGKDDFPAGRIVLLKYVKEDGFVFFSNYESNKGHQLAENNKAGMVFFWPELQRQVTIQGTVVKTSKEVSE